MLAGIGFAFILFLQSKGILADAFATDFKDVACKRATRDKHICIKCNQK